MEQNSANDARPEAVSREHVPPDVVLVVDVANVMGSRPDGWWRDRRAAARKIVEALSTIQGTDVTLPDAGIVRLAGIVAVIEGAARGIPDPVAGVDVVEAERDGDSSIVAVVEQLIAIGR